MRDIDSFSGELDKIYDTSKGRQENWYRQKPYTFIYTSSSGEQFYFNLPISPHNISITTHFATNLIATMYGTVEEHSEQRYFDISISGTTGMTPTYHKAGKAKGSGTEAPESSDMPKNEGRLKFKVKDAFKAGGFAQRTLDILQQAADRASDILGTDKVKPGVAVDQTGYVAFHNFYKFLLQYKKETSNSKTAGPRSSSSNNPLVFVNYKDHNKYDVSISTFQLTRDAENPMLYNYNIVMRGYNLTSALKSYKSPEKAEEEKEQLEKLGLSGIKTSAFSVMANKARQAKAAAYAAIAAAKGAGR